jgi:aryl carrier-like protein
VLSAQLPAGTEISMERNFFDAGLDSYGLIRLLHELRRAGFTWLELIDLFTWPSLAALARVIREGPPAGRNLVSRTWLGASGADNHDPLSAGPYPGSGHGAEGTSRG